MAFHYRHCCSKCGYDKNINGDYKVNILRKDKNKNSFPNCKPEELDGEVFAKGISSFFQRMNNVDKFKKYGEFSGGLLEDDWMCFMCENHKNEFISLFKEKEHIYEIKFSEKGWYKVEYGC